MTAAPSPLPAGCRIDGSAPEVLVMGPLPVIRDNPACGLVLHRFWEERDEEAFLSSHAERIRAIATSAITEIPAALLDRLPRLEIVASFGVGYDRIDLDAAKRRGIVITNAGDALTEEVADLALGLLIATLRRLPQADRYIREGRWAGGPYPLSSSLRGRTVGIVGLGRIGRAVARRLEAARVAIAYHDRHEQTDISFAFYQSLADLAHAVDTLILTAPGGDDTKGMIDAPILAALGPRGVLINVARGSLVDEAALGGALADGVIWGAGLDVFFEEPSVSPALLAHENVVVLPHIGSASVETREAMGWRVLENLNSWFDGKGPLTPVPETPWPPMQGQK